MKSKLSISGTNLFAPDKSITKPNPEAAIFVHGLKQISAYSFSTDDLSGQLRRKAR